MGLVEKSSVTAFPEDYYEKHPLDNTEETKKYQRFTEDQRLLRIWGLSRNPLLQLI